mmetsp:Transcript_118518/g.205862  ORF Transcript_118518/g.205862 Transcript_118518/m.205862 type:complete len:707 (-) Transcript_118518:173-2293(-)
MATWTSGNNITFDEDRHGQAHIYNVVPKQPLSLSNDECWAQINKANSKPDQPVTTELWKGDDPLNGHAKSKTVITCTIRIPKSEEVFSLPMWTSATAGDVVEALHAKIGCGTNIHFYYKQGCNFKTLRHVDTMVRNVWVKGLTTFKRPFYGPIEHPFLIIGAGHIGLRMAMSFLHDRKYSNFLCVDRVSRVGGTSWQFQANSTSKLQTEYGVYHLDFDVNYPIPNYFKTPWPGRDDLLWHFKMVSERVGIMPHIHLNTNVKTMEVIKKKGNTGPKCCDADHYVMTLQKTEGDNWQKTKGQPWEMSVQGISFFPGNLTIPRREQYKGEELFGGQIEYGMFGDANYSEVTGKDVALVGHGAFAVENVRTCCEFHCNKIYLVCRRKNIACPRVPSWFANRSFIPVQAATFLDVMQPMYDFLGWDVWDYYAVKGNKDRTQCSIEQKVRFAIGDIYFLAGYFGKMEVCVEPNGVKRVAQGELVLASGRRLENLSVILKMLGLVGLPDNDRLMKMKTLHGFWAEADPRRYLVAEPVSVMASNMGSTSFSPGAIAWATQGTYFMLWPQDFQPILDSNMMPKHTADDADGGTYRPAYVVDARHGTMTSIAIPVCCPQQAQEQQHYGFVKAVRQRLCHPMKQFLQEAQADWDHYGKMFIEEGFGKDKKYPDYPYTYQNMQKWVQRHMKETNEPFMPSDIEDLGLSASEAKTFLTA